LKESIKKFTYLFRHWLHIQIIGLKKIPCALLALTHTRWLIIHPYHIIHHPAASIQQVSYSVYTYTYAYMYTEKKLLDKAVFSTVLVILYIWRNKRCYEYGIYKEFQCTQKKVYIIVISKYISSFVRNKKRGACIRSWLFYISTLNYIFTRALEEKKSTFSHEKN